MSNLNLTGCFTAIVTPFDNGRVCYATLQRLVEEQIAAGVAGLVPVGTTGESPTLTVDEHKQVIETVIAAANRRCLIIAGTGGNATEEALELTLFAKSAGADATLQVTPYYNKPTQEGLYRHFSMVAEQGGLPVVLYNVPGRTGVGIAVETVRRLRAHQAVVAIKEASGSVDRVSEILDSCDITVLSGDDMLTLPMIAVGATGVISVASNVVPEAVVQLTREALAGNYAAAREIHRRYYRLFTTLFIETNPIPVKAAMAMAGKIKEEYRMPLCPMASSSRSKLAEVLTQVGVI